jgi:hypothetical protein
MRRPRHLSLALTVWVIIAASMTPALAQPQQVRPGPALSAAKPEPRPVVPRPIPKPAIPPLPPPRPSEPAAPSSDAGAPQVPAVDAAALAACLKDLDARGGEATPVKLPDEASDAIADCAIPGPVRFARVRLPDGSAVTLDSPVTVRCTLALELADWIRDDLSAIATRHGAALAQLAGVGGHACRMRNNQTDAPISEHASGNAFDLRAVKLADGRVIELAHADAATKAVREEVRESACARFSTVLGPGADSSHVDHLHVDVRQRRGGFRLCQWTVE